MLQDEDDQEANLLYVAPCQNICVGGCMVSIVQGRKVERSEPSHEAYRITSHSLPLLSQRRHGEACIQQRPLSQLAQPCAPQIKPPGKDTTAATEHNAHLSVGAGKPQVRALARDSHKRKMQRATRETGRGQRGRGRGGFGTGQRAGTEMTIRHAIWNLQFAAAFGNI